MALSTFVGRENEINRLTSILQRGTQKQGRVVFVEGEAGAGKSLFLQALQEKVGKQSDAEKIRFVYGYCYEDSGNQNAYQPFVEILSTLIAKDASKGGLAKLFLTIVKETGSDWLGMIPGIGPAISASLKTATIIAGQWLSGSETKSTIQQSETLANQYIQTISKIADKFAPLVLLIEDGHWIDDASSRLLERLGQKIDEKQLIIVVTYRPSYLSENHPLLSVRNEIMSKNRGDIISLSGLNHSQVNEYIIRRFGDPVHPRLAEWLVSLCKGNPLFMTQYLSLLEQEQMIKSVNGSYALDGGLKFVADEWKLEGRLKEVIIPNSVEALLEQRIKRLVEEDREMLQLGAVQGELFMSSVLAELLDRNESDVLKRLRKVIEQHRLISIYTGSEVDTTRTEIYSFEHILLQQALYNKLSPRERVLYHREVADQLVKMVNQDHSPSRKMLLDIAHHYDLGQVHQSAADYYYRVIQSLAADGARTEAFELSKRALRNVNHAANLPELKAKIIIQLIGASYTRIDKELRYLDLIEEAKAAANQTGDKGLMAQVKFQEGSLHYSLSNLAKSVSINQEALELINQTDDPIGKYVITSIAGHQMCGVDLQKGLKLQYEAQEIFNSQVLASYQEIPSSLKRYYYSAKHRIGVAEFDSGNYGEAYELLLDSTNELRANHIQDELIWALNFLGQLYIAMGLFEDAENIIKEALAIDTNSEQPSNAYGYNLTLLGKLYLEWNRVTEAELPMRQGIEESLRIQIKWELPLARNYYSELLMHPDFKRRDLDEATRQLELNIDETRASEFHRSLVAALSFRALVALAKNQPDLALDYSTQAVAHLQKMGTLPALRTEEILFNHYQVLIANHQIEDASVYLKQAHETLLNKAESITNPEHRKSFIERVNLSQAILTAVNQQ